MRIILTRNFLSWSMRVWIGGGDGMNTSLNSYSGQSISVRCRVARSILLQHCEVIFPGVGFCFDGLCSQKTWLYFRECITSPYYEQVT